MKKILPIIFLLALCSCQPLLVKHKIITDDSSIRITVPRLPQQKANPQIHLDIQDTK